MTRAFSVVEASVDDLGTALAEGRVSSVELVVRYLNRIGLYDRSGVTLNSVPILNPRVLDEARASDLRRAEGRARGPLDGIPFTVKDSFCARGLPVANGSPAFASVIAHKDAFAVARLRAAGAVLLGLTNMPPMAAGGMQRGVYGRAESPYNRDYMTSAFASGSSNGSGTSTAASFAALGLGEETWSSGRAPASNNSLVAYTPSRGVISVRGNWPLVPTMDVVVPHARSVADLLHLLDAVVADDADASGDLWRMQPWIPIPAASTVRPPSYRKVEPLPLAGVRLAAPRMYLNGDPESRYPIRTRDSVMALWAEFRADLERAGAVIVETDFPVVENYEKQHPQSMTMVERGLVPSEFMQDEISDLAVWSVDLFLQQNGDPTLNSLADADESLVFPAPTGALPDQFGEFDFDTAYDIADYPVIARAGFRDWTQIASLEAGLRGLELVRKLDFEDWLAANEFDAVIFPTAADVARSNADTDPEAAADAWRNGVWVSNGNLVPRHLGIPTVTIPMGAMADTAMPVGVTIAGAAYTDETLLRLALAAEQLRERRVTPSRTPALQDEAPFGSPSTPARHGANVELSCVRVTDDTIVFQAQVSGPDLYECVAFVDGTRVEVDVKGPTVTGLVARSRNPAKVAHSEWREPYGPLVVIAVRAPEFGTFATVGSTPRSAL